nr:hypothetical protein [Abalone asfa-like virus]
MNAQFYGMMTIYWFVAFVKKENIPEINEDFLVIDDTGDYLPVYYITINQGLYVLFETQQSEHIPIIVYLNENVLYNKILVHNITELELVTSNQTNLINRQIIDIGNAPEPTKNIIKVLEVIPATQSLPNSVKQEFVKKYTSLIPDIKPLLPPTNG